MTALPPLHRARWLWLAGILLVAASLPAQQPRPADPAGRAAPVLPDSVVEARTTALAGSLRCPVCQGLSIQDSPSELAQQMRALIKSQVAEGKSDSEVRGYFLSKYGEFILLEPRARGFNLLAYLLPAAILAVGGVIVALNVRRWTRPSGGAGAQTGGSSPGV